MGWAGGVGGHASSLLKPPASARHLGSGFFFPSHTMIPEEEGKEKEAPCHDEAGGSLRGERQPAAGPARNPALLPAQRTGPAWTPPRARVWTDGGRRVTGATA